MSKLEATSYPTIRFWAALPVCAALLVSGCDKAGSGDQTSSRLHGFHTELAVELDFSQLPHTPDFIARVFQLPAGGWGVSSGVFDGVIQLFDSAGSPTGTLGRRGSGPGEFGGSVFGASVGRELWIMDPKYARVSFYTADLELLGGRPLQDSYGRVFSIGPGSNTSSVLFSGFFFGGGSISQVTRDGAADRIGGEVPETTSSDAGAQIQFAAAAADGLVWTITQADGTVRVHDADLNVVRRLSLDLSSIVAELEWNVRPFDGAAPRPEVLGVTSFDGLFVVAVGVPDRNWSPDVTSRTHGITRVFDSLLVAIDTESGDVVASDRLDDLCMPANGRILSCVDELGESIKLLSMSFGPLANTANGSLTSEPQ